MIQGVAAQSLRQSPNDRQELAEISLLKGMESRRAVVSAVESSEAFCTHLRFGGSRKEANEHETKEEDAFLDVF